MPKGPLLEQRLFVCNHVILGHIKGLHLFVKSIGIQESYLLLRNSYSSSFHSFYTTVDATTMLRNIDDKARKAFRSMESAIKFA